MRKRVLRGACLGAALVFAWARVAAAAEVRVTGIRAVCRNGQTFITWKDAADQWGLVTVENVRIQPGEPTTLTIERTK